MDLEDIAGAFTLLPQFATRAGMEVGDPRLSRRIQRFGIHEGYHEHVASLVVNHHSSEEALVVELRHKGPSSFALGSI